MFKFIKRMVNGMKKVLFKKVKPGSPMPVVSNPPVIRARRVKLQTTREPVDLARNMPVNKVLGHRRKRGKRKAEKELVYRTKSGELKVSKDGEQARSVSQASIKVKQVAESARTDNPAINERQQAITPRMVKLSRRIPYRISSRTPRITPPMPRLR